MTRYVLGFYFRCPHVLLVHKSKPAWQVGKLNGIGGKIEDGESPLDAMKREFREESSIAAEIDWRYVVSMYGEDWHVFVFTSSGDYVTHGAVNGTDDEPVSFCEIDNLPNNVISNLRWLIPMCRDQIDYNVRRLTSDPTTFGERRG